MKPVVRSTARMQWHDIARCLGQRGCHDRFGRSQFDRWEAEAAQGIADHPESARLAVIPIDADFKGIAAFDPAQPIDATQAHSPQTDAFIEQLQSMLLALSACFVHRSLAGGGQLQPQHNDGAKRQQRQHVFDVAHACSVWAW
jgi:hypothetical protein